VEEFLFLWYFPGETVGKKKTLSVSIIRALTEIRKWHFPNTSQHYYSTSQPALA